MGFAHLYPAQKNGGRVWYGDLTGSLNFTANYLSLPASVAKLFRVLQHRHHVERTVKFRRTSGYYLAALGAGERRQISRNLGVTKPFVTTINLIFFFIFPHLLHRALLIGVDVTANQEEISDHETFQLEYDMVSSRWYIRTMQDKYFTLQPGGGIQANETKRSALKS